MNYRIEKRDAIRVLGKKIALKPTLEENFQITPVFWQQSSMDGTVETLAGMMDTDLLGLMGVSTWFVNPVSEGVENRRRVKNMKNRIDTLRPLW